MEQEYKYMVCTSCMTFNHAPYIVDALNGFTMQETTFPVYYLITDDASTDGEPEVIKHYLAEHFHSPYRTEETDDYNLICAIHKTNPNCIFIVFLLKYNHYSIKKSKLPYQTEWRENAKYIALCEGDDYWIEPLKLQKQVDYMEAHHEYGLCHSACKMLFQKTYTFVNDPSSNLCSTINDVKLINLISGYRIQTPSVLIRASINNQAKLLDSFLFSGYFLMSDTSLWWQIRKLSKIHYMQEPMVVYRQVENSASHQSGAKFYRFDVSMKELDYYLVKTDIKDHTIIDSKKLRLQKAIRNYKAFERGFESKILPNVKLTLWDKLLISSGLLSFWLNSVKLFIVPKAKSVIKRIINK